MSVAINPDTSIKSAKRSFCSDTPSSLNHTSALPASEQKLLLAKVWFLRAFRKIAKPEEFFKTSEQHSAILRDYFSIDCTVGCFSAVMDKLQREQIQLESAYKNLFQQGTLFSVNLRYLQTQMGLSEAEQNLLLFFSVMHDESDLEAIERCSHSTNRRHLCDLLASVLDCKSTQIRAGLSSESLLRQSGFLIQSNNMFAGWLDAFEVPGVIREALFNPLLSGDKFSSPFVTVSSEPKLTLDDFYGFTVHNQLITHYIQRALAGNKVGANVLLYGAPGTGKTEYAKVIAKVCGAVLMEVPSQSDKKEALTGQQRVRFAVQAGRMYQGKGRVLLFDEAEDVFNGPLFGRSTASKHKAWINHVLDSCLLPTVWISNDVSDMDPAFIRRFDVIIDFDDVKEVVRVEQFSKIVHQALSGDMLSKLAGRKDISAAMVERAADMAELKVAACQESFDDAFIDSLNCCLKAQGKPKVEPFNKSKVEFDSAFVKTTENLDRLADAISTQKYGRLCIFGPPGTGKTAFCHWLAKQAGMPLLVKRASDLLGKYVGDNEKMIAAAFAQATHDGSILLIDEVDSLLSDRASGQSSWEKRATNELLTQLDAYQGIFIACTNLMDEIDAATMRRFDFKLHFDYLNANQSELLLRKTCHSLTIAGPTERDIAEIRQLSFLTPGDYAMLARRHRLSAIKSAADFIRQLQAETGFKRQSCRRIGF
ncbi:AAA family ATPase [Alkalimonas sp. MEB108]|uniref:AAA family ATPase n=1 Tax=Alkalimonas cellulosilytica TaxID=3058395 RepID=A0ABU7J9E8_9GAMM|nr:AAA family ATPase [Alkalimonas sp. MEB108]MEE2003166.1 AAA family ATPase [Alkalimonas sp. MEB108]